MTELHGAALEAHLKKLAREEAAEHLALDGVVADLAQAVADQVVESEPVLKLAEEDVSLFKKTEDIGGVQVSRITRTYTQPVEELLRSDRVEVERVPIDQPVSEIPPIREEDDVIIVPVVEEVLQYHRQLILKEEVRLRRVTATEKFEDDVLLHRQEAVVTRLAPEPELDGVFQWVME